MFLNKIVSAVNAKSFGETNWTYDDIYPYFAQAISEINGELEDFRRIADAPYVSESDSNYATADYNALPDTHILNYIVTYITVAMDNAQLATTSRTQAYESQLSKYKRQLIADLYKWMPLRQQSNNFFDFENTMHVNEVPNPGKVWYDESYGKLSSRTVDGFKQRIPTVGVKAENPYGKLVPKDPNETIKEGLNKYRYIFIPFDAFLDYYIPIEVEVTIRGYDVEAHINYDTVVTDVNTIMLVDAVFGDRTSLFRAAWSVMKSAENKSKAFTGSYTIDNKTYSYIFTQYGEHILAYGDNSVYEILDDVGNATVASMMSPITVDESSETLIIGNRGE